MNEKTEDPICVLVASDKTLLGNHLKQKVLLINLSCRQGDDQISVD